MEFVAITLEGRALRLITTPDGAAELRADEAPPGPESVFERLDLAHGRVAFRTADGRYLARHAEHLAEGAHDGAALHVVSELTQCAAFEELGLPGGSVSLRACDLRFLGVHASGRVVADRVANGSWERFEYRDIPVPVPSFPVSSIALPAFPVQNDPVLNDPVQADPVPASGSSGPAHSRCSRPSRCAAPLATA